MADSVFIQKMSSATTFLSVLIDYELMPEGKSINSEQKK